MRTLTILLATAVAAGVLVPEALATRFTDDSYFVPKGQVGEPYSHWFHGDGGCGPALPYQFRILSGSPPPGISLSTEGHLSGTPTAAGSFSFWVELSDQNPPSADWCTPKQAEREFTVVVEGGAPAPPAPPPLAVTTAAAPVGTVGLPYAVALQASGGGTQSWSVASGSLPPGLALASNGMLAGTPSAAGAWSFTARVAGDGRSAERSLTVVVRAPLAVQAPGTRSAEVGLPLAELAVSAAGGSGAVSLRVDGSLPPGVAFDAATGRFGGTPVTAGSYAFRVVATDGEGRTAAAELGIVVAPRLTIRTPGLVVGRVGRAYRSDVRTAGGVSPRSFRPVSRLPAGLRLDAARGILLGTPRRAGTYRVAVEARDALGATAQRTFSLRIRRAR
ncbi:MAG: Ig domain-containing protein [Pseudomonadota bacterium]